MDRNFDKLAERFERRVYGGLKGDVRLAVIWRDLLPVVQRLEQSQQAKRPQQALNVLDIGGGLAQISIALAARGHRVVYNDISQVMLGKAQRRASAAGVAGQFSWQCGNYLELPEPEFTGPELPEKGGYQLILCHALLEWLDQPQQVFGFSRQRLAAGGYISLCFYNPAAKIYRNLIRGNFDWLENRDDYRSDSGSLTPNNPCELAQVRGWLQQAKFDIRSESGIRVFHDYVVEKRGGHASPEAVLEMELNYSGQEPYKWLGRYLHIVAQRRQSTC